MNIVVILLMTAAVFVFVVLLTLVAAHGKPSKEDSFTDLLKKLSFAEWGMAFGVGTGFLIAFLLSNTSLYAGLGIVVGAAIGLAFGAVLDAQKA